MTNDNDIVYKLDEEEWNIYFKTYIDDKLHIPSPFKIFTYPLLYMEDPTVILVPENL